MAGQIRGKDKKRQLLKHFNMVFVSMAELRDRFEALLQVESTVYCVFDNYLTEYVDHGLSSSRNAAWRTEYIRWSFSIIDKHKLDREFVAVAVNYFDRFMSTLPFIEDVRVYKLIGATSLYLSIKIFRDAGKCADAASFSALFHGDFSAAEIEETEQSMLRALNWRVYLELMVILLPKGASTYSRRALFERIKFILEVSHTVPFFFGKMPSNVAAAAFIEVLSFHCLPSSEMGHAVDRFTQRLRSVGKIDTSSEELRQLRDDFRTIYGRNLHQMNGPAFEETVGCLATPAKAKKPTPIVSP